ncbi:hypothetical protein C5167_043752 [Papaver somniferum]|uniref:Uncharacterized protein n=1 Tax=Papaver somniferum TaxID=3469 RepID=A0A4Y7LAI1_PAPSO|nr:hypothetical protein C5167_043752 [Papaver somniferum]
MLRFKGFDGFRMSRDAECKREIGPGGLLKWMARTNIVVVDFTERRSGLQSDGEVLDDSSEDRAEGYMEDDRSAIQVGVATESLRVQVGALEMECLSCCCWRTWMMFVQGYELVYKVKKMGGFVVTKLNNWCK